jgi:hypothetical protein
VHVVMAQFPDSGITVFHLSQVYLLSYSHQQGIQFISQEVLGSQDLATNFPSLQSKATSHVALQSSVRINI